jgi:mannitol/fructose-specific phosphotransferase system IIA component (Ntr-type)
MKEKGLRQDDPYDEILDRAEVIDLEADASFDQALQQVAEALAGRVGLDPEQIAEKLRETGRYGGAPISHGIALLHFRSDQVDRAELALARSGDGLCVSLSPDDPAQPDRQSCDVHGLYALISPEGRTGQHLRILAELADRAEDETFGKAWRRIRDPQRLKETLLRDARFLELFAGQDPATEEFVGAQAGEIQLPADCFLALIRRDGHDIEPRLNTRLQRGDHLTFLGRPDAIEKLYQRFIEPESD